MQRRAFCGRSNTMLDRDFAEKFIDRVTRYTDYNVNIMDERGIIIASRDKARIGQYHEVAYRLVTGTEEIVDTTGSWTPPACLSRMSCRASIWSSPPAACARAWWA